MVIVLPMILKDREAAVQDEEIDIVMPGPLLEEEVDISDGEPPVVTEGESTVTEVIEDAPIKAEVIDLPKVESPPKAPEPVKEVAKPKAETKQAEKPAPAKKADQIKTAATKSNQFYVQIGVFSEMANVKKLQGRLSDLGYQSVTEDVTTDKGVKTRLRTVTFDGRNEAAIALENIKDSGLTGMVVSQK